MSTKTGKDSTMLWNIWTPTFVIDPGNLMVIISPLSVRHFFLQLYNQS